MKSNRGKLGCIKVILRLVAIGIVFVTVTIAVCNWVVIRSAKGRTYSEIDAVPYHKVGVVLGTVPYLPSGRVVFQPVCPKSVDFRDAVQS